jgi:ParB family chromosome partitioning protein
MAKTPKRGLGRGFESLLSPDFDKAKLLTSKDDRIESISVDKLVANPYQPRRTFEDQALIELADSIKLYGVVQPVVVTPGQAGVFTLIAGERRWRASKLAGLKVIPAIIRTSKKLEQVELALIENVQRVDLAPLEQAISIERWHEEFSVAYDTIAARLSKAPSTIVNTVRLLQLPELARDALSKHQISEGHARAILALKKFPDQQDKLLDAIIANGWSVRQAERYVTSVKEGVDTKAKVHERVQIETPLTKQLSIRLDSPVRIRRTAKGGAIEIVFKSDKDLERIIEFLEK